MKKTLAERFWTKVNKTDTCWLWTRSLTIHGYGKIGETTTGRTLAAHRVSWELEYGPIPEGMSILHKCDTPACVRPSHLFLGSQVENMKDMTQKGRRRKYDNKGELNPRARLTEADVIAARASYRAGVRVFILAANYGVSWSTMDHVVKGKHWKNVKEKPDVENPER